MNFVGEGGSASNASTRVGRCGATSLWFAFGAFTSAVTGIVLLAVAPTTTPSQVWEAVNIVAILLFLVAAPLGHLIGAGFGIAALIRPNDRVKFGVIGLLVNIGAVVFMVGSIVFAWKTIGFR